MTTYTIASTAKGATSAVVVKARSSIHDTETRWSKVSGTIEASPETLATDGAKASIDVDMTDFDAGDWLKNRKLRKDLAVEKHPQARFLLTELVDVVQEDGDSFSATARGVLQWRGREAAIEATGKGVVSADRIEATATFELDVTTLGVKPPKILMFKVEEVVSVEVRLTATSS